jgi:hypothetical protein
MIGQKAAQASQGYGYTKAIYLSAKPGRSRDTARLVQAGRKLRYLAAAHSLRCSASCHLRVLSLFQNTH